MDRPSPESEQSSDFASLMSYWSKQKGPDFERSSQRHGPGSDSVSLRSDSSREWGPNFKRCSEIPGPGSVSLRSDSSREWGPNFKRSSKVPGSHSDSVSLRSDLSKQWDPHFQRSSQIHGPGSDSVSLRSDSSREWGPNFKRSSEIPRPGSVSLRSDSSKQREPNFKRSSKVPGSHSDSVSLRSDLSKQWAPHFQRSSQRHGPGSDSVSLRSDSSREWGPNFKRNSEIPRPGSVSLRSDCSKGEGPLFKDVSPSDEGEKLSSGGSRKERPQLDVVFTRLEEDVLTFVKEQLQRFHSLLASEHPESSSEREEEQSSREAVLNIALDFLRRMDQQQLAHSLQHRANVGVRRDKLKNHLQQRFSHVFEGVAKAGDSAPLQQIYTELYLVEGGASEVNQEHEVRAIETRSRKAAAPESSITCEDMFKQQSQSEQPIRTVLTVGVAGVGKTVLTQKFSLDWAEGRANQDIQLLFPFTFRDLNVLRDTEFSLVELLHHFFSQTKGLCSFEGLQLLFICDGLDECRLPLDFSRTRVLTDPTESASVEELLVNLIRGDLLPSARLWITTRPAAANQIPAECVSMVTEVRGFSDPQKEQYFMKRITDEQQATAVISHIKSIRSLYIMSYIPLFCWILSTVLLHLMKTGQKLPQTMTQMYIHFLVVQAKVKNIKYHEGAGADLHWTPETREMVLSLGRLAFEQLQKGNLIFYESDLRECGLDPAEMARFSGVFTQVFREEPGLYQNKVYCFIHLSVQEFLAALHVHQTFFSSGENLLSPPHSSESPEVFYRSAVDQALQSPNGHLDLFLRFLLGLSLPTNHSLLQGLLTHTGSNSPTNQETVEYIKKKLNEEDLSAERSMNLLHCLNELNDHSLMEQIQKIMRGGSLSWLSFPAEWSALSFLLLSSDSDLEEFDLRKYPATEKILLKLLSVVKASTKAILRGCGLSSLSCAALASVLSSSSLTHLDLSNNDLQDSGVELLCEGLKSAPCRLDTLRLSGCLVSEKGGACLASALSSAPSHLTELDLSYNDPGSSAELLTALRAPQGPLLSLRLDPSGERWMVPGLRKYSCEFSLDPNTAHRELLLSEDKRSVTREEKQLYPLHEDRFMEQPQVMSSTGLRGHCYWEVEWVSWKEEVDVAVSYRGISRRGESCRFGDNDQSWSLKAWAGHYWLCHNGEETTLSTFYYCFRLGVFLDSEAGSLSFYEVDDDDKLFHIHTFFSSFSEPLFPGLGLSSPSSSVSLRNLRP